MLSRITPPTTGRIELYGRVGSLLEVGTGFHPELTGRENVYLNGSILGMRKPEIDRQFDEIVAFAGVERFLDTPVKRYSSGMYVRLAFAVAAHLETEILVVDEVLAVGDAEFQEKCIGQMRSATRSGRTVLLVSHNLPVIESIASRVALVHQGSLSVHSTADGLHRYAELRTTSDSARRVIDPSAPISLLDVSLLDQEAGRLDRTVRVRVTAELRDPAARYVAFGVILSSDAGVPVATGVSVVERECFERQRGTVVLRLPLDRLAAGRYTAELNCGAWATAEHWEKHDEVADAFALDLQATPGDSVSDRRTHPHHHGYLRLTEIEVEASRWPAPVASAPAAPTTATRCTGTRTLTAPTHGVNGTPTNGTPAYGTPVTAPRSRHPGPRHERNTGVVAAADGRHGRQVDQAVAVVNALDRRPRVVVWSPWGQVVRGGMPNLARNIVAGLRLVDVDAELLETAEIDLDDVDLVHFLGPSAEQIRTVRRAGVAVTLSPLYWPAAYNLNMLPDGGFPRSWKDRLRDAAVFSRAALRDDTLGASYRLLATDLERMRTYESVDLLLPNSTGEAEAMHADVGISTPSVAVPAGVDPALFPISPLPWSERSGIVSIGRFEPHKNQLGMIRALRDEPVTVTFVGHAHPDHPDYLEQCRSEAPSHWRILVGASLAELVEVTQRSRVHLLGSWFETTGLVSLEAALTGAAAVSSSRGYTRSCLGEWATYFDPADAPGVRGAVHAALARPPSDKIPLEIAERWSIEATGRAMLDAWSAHLPNWPRPPAVLPRPATPAAG